MNVLTLMHLMEQQFQHSFCHIPCTYVSYGCRGGIKNKVLVSLVRHGLLANVSAGVSITTEYLSGGKWLLYTTALWP